ncbi:MAG TPA: hypothetical protein VHJ82_06690, partial [Actinomycetota bacterium]|nr:hypothetical protein [Actinomycetota bacterium]
APIEDLFAAFVDGRKRKGWLPDAKPSLRTSDPPLSVQFDWDGGSRVKVTLTRKGPAKTTVSVVHSGLPSAQEAARIKQMWRDRFVAVGAKVAA